MMNNENAFAEVIESSTTAWVAQSWQWNKFAQYGSLVTIQSKSMTLFGLVHHVQTGSMDPSRYPFPYKKTQEELMAEQPQIFEFLKTSFSCIAMGYQENSICIHLTLPEPPPIHSFVYSATHKQAELFFASDQFLFPIFSSLIPGLNIDELLLATIRYQSQYNILTPERLKKYLEKYSLLIGNDYRRLKFFIERLSFATR